MLGGSSITGVLSRVRGLSLLVLGLPVAACSAGSATGDHASSGGAPVAGTGGRFSGGSGGSIAAQGRRRRECRRDGRRLVGSGWAGSCPIRRRRRARRSGGVAAGGAGVSGAAIGGTGGAAGAVGAATQPVAYRITFHHNWWSTNVAERMPRVRFGQVHAFNNYYGTGLGTNLDNDHCVRAALPAGPRIFRRALPLRCRPQQGHSRLKRSSRSSRESSFSPV